MTSPQTPLKIAVACSGLGHVHRGIETWADDLATALHRKGHDVTLFQGAGDPKEPWRVTLPCLRRMSPEALRLAKRAKRFSGWRYGMGNDYEVEETTFVRHLWTHIRKDYDILHVQDYWIGRWMEQLHRWKLSRPQVILAHGTEEPPSALSRFSNLQHLAPCYLDDWEKHRPKGQNVFAVPNFVKTDRFLPGNKVAARAEFGISHERLVILSVAALKKTHKRIDVLVQEFARFRTVSKQPALLVVAGAREAQTDEVIQLGKSLLGDNVLFLEGVPRDRIPTLYQAADVFTLASLHEMMPIAVLEALSSGLPVACNATPTLKWMVGAGGVLSDISKEGALAEQFLALSDATLRQRLSHCARIHAEENFSEDSVIEQTLAMYSQIMQGGTS